MSETDQYLTTGEMARLCGVTNRTVQFYEEKGLLEVTKRSEGGRRLFDVEALHRLNTICMLKSMGLSLAGIKGVLASESDNELICLLEEQKRVLSEQIQETNQTLTEISRMIEAIRDHDFSLHDAHDVGYAKNTSSINMGKPMSTIAVTSNELKKVHTRMILQGIVVDIVEIAAIAYGIIAGDWIAALCVLPLVLLTSVNLVREYYEASAYVCPQCHEVFRPTLGEFMFSSHTPKTRKLTCTHCQTKSWCAETDREVQ